MPVILQREETETLAKVKACEEELAKAQEAVHLLEVRLKTLRKNHSESVDIKWRYEIRRCIKNSEGKDVLATLNNVVNCIEFKKGIKADRKQKHKISTTILAMHREGELGKTKIDGEFYYGNKNLFNDDLITIKDEYQTS